jgi:hypothetical protein
MATLDIVETDLFFALRPEQPGQSKWWRYAETASGSEYLLESRYAAGSNSRLEARLTGGGHELLNIFSVAQVDHPPRPQENRPWQYTWVSTRRDSTVFTWGSGLVIPAIWEPKNGTSVSAMSNETNPATGKRATMAIDYVASGIPGTLNAMMAVRQRVFDPFLEILKFDVRFSPGGLHHAQGSIVGVTYVLTLKGTGTHGA